MKSNEKLADPHSTWFIVYHSWSNWNLEVREIVFEERRGKTRIAGKNLPNERREPTTELPQHSVWVSIITGFFFRYVHTSSHHSEMIRFHS